jgi:glycosyltransferase involved in cell wall biosynthesis
MKKLRVHVLYEYGVDLKPHGCAYIRLLLPLQHHANAGDLIVTAGETYAKADVILVDRTWFPGISPAAAAELVKRARKDGARIIYSIDDDLLDLAPTQFNRWPFTAEELMAVRYFAREADGIIVTTELLKMRLARLNENIYVVPNALDEQLWRATPAADGTPARSSKRKVIGYMGTQTHDADLMMILQALRATLRKYQDQVELQVIGAVADRAVFDAFAGLPVRTLDVGGNVEYPAFARWMVNNVKWDLAIAPLEDDVFTRCKSDIKFLDYSAVGIPGIYSNGPVYGKTVRHLETGYLADNNPDSWLDAFELLLNDDQLRQQIAERAQNYTFATRTLQDCASQWREAIFSIAGQQNNSRTGESFSERTYNRVEGSNEQHRNGTAN